MENDIPFDSWEEFDYSLKNIIRIKGKKHLNELKYAVDKDIGYIGYFDEKSKLLIKKIPSVFIYENYKHDILGTLFKISRHDYDFKKKQNIIPINPIDSIMDNKKKNIPKVKLSEVIKKVEKPDTEVQYSNVFGSGSSEDKLYCGNNTTVSLENGKFIPYDSDTNEEILMDFKYFKNDTYHLYNTKEVKIGMAELIDGKITVHNL